jgi:nucleoside-diphosphate-sugar epimerase
MFVLGATGHLGQAVVRHALECGHAVTAASRQPDPIALRGLDVTITRMDGGFSTLAEVSAGHDVLVDAAAPYPLELCVPGSPAWRQVIDGAVARTRRVLDAARRNRLRLVFISSFTTLPRAPFPNLESPLGAMETAWRRSAYPYFEAKEAMERTVMAAAEEGLPAVIVNPAACLGPWEFRADDSSFVRLVMARRMPLVMDHMLSVIDVRDVAEAIERALALEIFGRPIALAGHNLSLLEVARQIVALDGAGGLMPAAADARAAALTAFWTSATFAAFRHTTPDVWRAVPLAADGFPMVPSPEQIAMGFDLHPLWVTLRDAIAFHRTWRPA